MALSVAEVIVRKVGSFLTSMISATIKGNVMRFLKRIFATAITRPVRFHIQIKHALTAIRWAKFLAPLIGTCNKLKEHCIDLYNKKLQKQRKLKAQIAWKKLLDKVREQQLLEKAVNFRKRRMLKAKKRILLMKHRASKKEAFAIKKKHLL